MNKKKQNIFVITIAILVVIIGLLTFVLIRRENAEGSLSFDKNASTWNQDEKKESLADSQIKIPGYDNITFASGTYEQQITLANPEGNPCNFKFELYIDQEKSPVYESEMVKPGTAIRNIRMCKEVPEGKHMLRIHILTYDTESGKALNSAVSNASLTVI